MRRQGSGGLGGERRLRHLVDPVLQLRLGLGGSRGRLQHGRPDRDRGKGNPGADHQPEPLGSGVDVDVGVGRVRERGLEELLDAASHLPAWAVSHVDDGYLPTEELVETIRRVRRVGTIYTKDFTELAGARAVIITA